MTKNKKPDTWDYVGSNVPANAVPVKSSCGIPTNRR